MSTCAPPKVPSSRAEVGVSDKLYRLFLNSADAVPPQPVPPQVPPKGDKPLPTGCSGNGVTKTVVTFAGIDGSVDRLEAALHRSALIIEFAAAKGNDVHACFLGGALPPDALPPDALPPGTNKDKSVVEILNDYVSSEKILKNVPARNVHLFVGPREMGHLKSRDENVRKYLLNAKVVECFGPDSMDANGSGGVWIKSTSTDAATWLNVGSPTLLEWRTHVNKKWLQAVLEVEQGGNNVSDRQGFWLTLAEKDEKDDALVPSEGLLTPEGVGGGAMFARPTSAPFGLLQRRLLLRKPSDAWPEITFATEQLWLDLGTASESIAIGVKTFCFSTMKYIRSMSLPPIDRTLRIENLQFDVSCALCTLCTHETAGSKPWARFLDLRGQLGPCVSAGRNGNEALRVIHFRGPEMPPVTMLLPELYLRYTLQDYLVNLEGVDLGSFCVFGVMGFDDRHGIKTRFPNLSEAEQSDAARFHGLRIWRGVHSNPNDALGQVFTPDPSRSLLQGLGGVQEVAGKRVDSGTGTTTFHVLTHSADSLSGLAVKWVFAPGETNDMPCLDVDNDDFQKFVT